MTQGGWRYLVLTATVLVFTGCARWHIAGDVQSLPSGVAEHVRFLASPSLNGRKPQSAGAIRARRYIARHFAEHGLVPWGHSQSFEQHVKFGTNLVGVLPGQDPSLKDEIVLVSAHYDHLGGGNLGAADNAGGVAALLDTLTLLSERPLQNKRTLCFAAFDCEENGLWGSIAFTNRADVDSTRFTAVVNADVVGRPAFGHMNDTLFLGLSHASNELSTRLASLNLDGGPRVLEYNILLPGPCSDHAAFNTLGIPSLFFSTGPFPDYHTKLDTVQRIDMDLVTQTSKAVRETVAWLANASDCFDGPFGALANNADLSTIHQVLLAMQNKSAPKETHDEDSGTRIAECATAIEAYLKSEEQSADGAQILLTDSLLALKPWISQFAGWGQTMKSQEEDTYIRKLLIALFFIEKHQSEIMEMYRQVAACVEEGKETNRSTDSELATHGTKVEFVDMPRKLRRWLDPDVDLLAYPLCDDEFVEFPDGELMHLVVLMPEIHMVIKKLDTLLSVPHGWVEFGWTVYECNGDADTLIDYCLSEWIKRTFISGTWNDAGRRARSWNRVIQRIDPQWPEFSTWVQANEYRLRHSGRDERDDHHLRILREKNPDMLREVLSPFLGLPDSEEYTQAIRDILFDATVPADIRAMLVSRHYRLDWDAAMISFEDWMLRDLKALSDDTTPILTRAMACPLALPPGLGPAALLQAYSAENTKMSETTSLPAATIGEAARKRLLEIESLGKRIACKTESGCIQLRGPCTLTAFPRGKISIERSGNSLNLSMTGPDLGPRDDFMMMFLF